jgi:Coenzyme PQQ synthesis protein D (PqqD)
MPTENAENAAVTSHAIVDGTMISRSPSVLAAEVGGEIVMMSIERGSYFGLDAIGSDIWNRIEPPCSFAALIDGLAAEYDGDRATIATDVRLLLDRMAVQNVVRLA